MTNKSLLCSVKKGGHHQSTTQRRSPPVVEGQTGAASQGRKQLGHMEVRKRGTSETGESRRCSGLAGVRGGGQEAGCVEEFNNNRITSSCTYWVLPTHQTPC